MSSLDSLTPGQRALLAERLKGRAIAKPQVLAVAVPATGETPVSAEQEQMLAHTLFAPGNPVYNEAVTFMKQGPLDLDALRTAFDGLVARHDILHTTFRRVGRQMCQIVNPAPTHPLPVHDLSGLPRDEQEARAGELVLAEATRRYDLKQGPLVRPLLVRFAEDQHRLFLCMHHMVFDGVSLYRVLLPELIELYAAAVEGRPTTLGTPVQYVDYTRWEQSGALDEELRRHLPYWREHLAGAPTLSLPLVRERPAEQNFAGATEWFVVPAELVDRLRTLGTATGSTLFHVLVAGFALLLQRYGGGDEVVFATVADLRRRREFESMVGYCLTPMPLRIRVGPDAAFDELVERVRGEILDGLSRLVPFGRLVSDLQPPQVPGAGPIFQAMLVLEPPSSAPPSDWTLHQLDPAVGRELGHAKTDFNMELDQRTTGEISGRFIFNNELFDADFGTRVVADWVALLNDLPAHS